MSIFDDRTLHFRAFELWRLAIHTAFGAMSTSAMHAPMTIVKEVLERSLYIEHFPQNVVEAGSIQSHPEKLYVTPAPCLHVYESCKDSLLKSDVSVVVEGSCMRFENGAWEDPYRLPGFTMIEFVTIGTETQLRDKATQVRDVMLGLFECARLPVSCVPATDAFFLGSNDGAQAMQRLKGLKKEFVISDNAKSIALASFNMHEDYFGKSFKITCDDVPAHSLCAAFGLERLSHASVEKWGTDDAKWPTFH